MRCSSSGAIEVPVGLDGDASSTPRVLSFQAASHFLAGELEALLGGGRNQHRRAFGGADEMPVARIARVGHQDFVAGLDQGQAGQLQRGRCAGRDDDAAGRHVDAKPRRHTSR